MEHENRKLGEAMRVVFDGRADPQWDNDARGLLAAVRRGEGETSLRQQAARIQSRLTGGVNDAKCREVVGLAQRVADEE